MALTGHNPFEGYTYLFQGGLMNIERIGNTLATSTALFLTGISVAFAFKTGLFNIGASGQMLMGGLFATAIGLTWDLPKPILLPIILIASIIGGGLWALIPGLLKAKFNVHEVVATIMMNWIAYWTINYTIPAYFKGEYLETESRIIGNNASLRVEWLTDLFNGSYINLGFFIAVAVIIIIAIVLDKTVLGFTLKAVGFNKESAKYSGMNVNKSIILSMMIAGGLAGLGGATFYLGYSSNIQIGVLPAQGFDGIAVALLGANNPYGALAAAVFFGLLHSGKGFMNAMTDVPPEIGDTIIATIIYFAATSLLIHKFLDKITAFFKGGLKK
ncbi:MAG: ABC transporter permease [Spirochaetales bacterium]|nr:ABC transporter permease [Spirochaetales bacterium]